MSNVVAAEAAQLSNTEVEKLDASLAGSSPLANLDGQTLDALGVQPDAEFGQLDPAFREALTVGRPIEGE